MKARQSKTESERRSNTALVRLKMHHPERGQTLHQRVSNGEAMAFIGIGLETQQRRRLSLYKIECQGERIWLRGNQRRHCRKERPIIVVTPHLIAQRLGRAKRHDVRIANFGCR